MRRHFQTIGALAALLAAVPASAALVDRGGGMIYDDMLNISWLADMNYAKTSGYVADGRMTWAEAGVWANSLVYGGFDDWRLPTLNASDTTCSTKHNPPGGFPPQYYGFNCTGGELSHLFVSDLGNKADESVLNQVGDTPEQIANLALFSNVQSSWYWSGTRYVPNAYDAWLFRTNEGFQFLDDRILDFYAVAVRPGDVAMPEPQSAALALLALGLTVVVQRKAS